jgi:outer membrane receptor protein involved in Fe transport
VTTATSIDALLEETDLLPAVNATYSLAENMNVRFGYSVTLSRPELREMSPFDMYDYETGYSEVGNPDVKSTEIQNWDARWEVYPGARELFAVSLFRKTLFQPIENIVEASGGGYILSPQNGRDGRLKGVELEARAGFRRFWDGLDRLLPLPKSTSAYDRFALTANYSRVESSVRVQITTDPTGAPIYRVGPLQGQSSYSLNLGTHYGSEALEASILYAAFGNRLAQVGAGAYPNSLPDIYEIPLKSLDFTLSKHISHTFRFKFSVENILDSTNEFHQLDKVTRRVQPGRAFGFTLDLKG